MPVMSPNMNMPISTIGVDTGLTWETNLNASLSVLDGHDHSNGKGVAISPAGLNINTDLPFNNNQATALKASVYQSQTSLATLLASYAIGPDYYFNDGAGNVVQLTKNGSVNATSSGISSGSATASFVASVLVVNAAPLTPANIQVASVLLGNNVASSNFITLSPPSAMAASYTLILPSLPLSNALLAINTSGNITSQTIDSSIILSGSTVKTAAGVPDAVSIQNISGTLSAKNTEFTYELKLNGNYGYLVSADQVDGLVFFNYNVEIVNVYAWIRSAGSSGTTEVDLKVATTPAGPYTTIFSTTPKFDSTAAAGAYVDSTGVVTPPTGATAGVLSTVNIVAGSAIRMDLISSMVDPDSVGLTIIFKQR